VSVVLVFAAATAAELARAIAVGQPLFRLATALFTSLNVYRRSPSSARLCFRPSCVSFDIVGIVRSSLHIERPAAEFVV
jgi:hypothetical protein